ncbi:hypothetical protein [Streptomyces boluensis]|uniref:Uncharacterized protein n=1 Tax=Streptomyces boluensis TaxID=1775135 RepID=A0A964UKF2_9ACTN|nr:hypothetical protein [Streptomyces boluensis]NBE50176.1 hypothetical protein [Streptomyces boluensis]
MNGAPLAVGIVLSCSTEATGVDVVGRLTLGVVWGVLQLGVFLASVWWYEDRCARVRHHVELSPAPLGPAGAADAPPMREAGW